MIKTIDDAIKIINAITNIDVVDYVAKVGPFDIQLADAVKADAKMTPEARTLYSVDLLNGRGTAKSVNLNIAHTKPCFVNSFCAYHYTQVAKKALEQRAKVVEAWTMYRESLPTKSVPKVMQVRKNAFDARWIALEAVIEAATAVYGNAPKDDGMIKDFYAALFGGTYCRTTISAYSVLKNHLMGFENDTIDNVVLRELRPLVACFLKGFWRESDNFDFYVYNCSATLARHALDVFRVVYTGRKINKMGCIDRTFNYDLGLSEMVKIIMQDLQAKIKNVIVVEPAK